MYIDFYHLLNKKVTVHVINRTWGVIFIHLFGYTIMKKIKHVQLTISNLKRGQKQGTFDQLLHN